mgnify:CR=1 FL=1
MFYLRSAILAPLLVAQGRRTRRQVPVLPEPPGDREGHAGAGPALRILIAGDSAAAGVGTAHQDEALLGRLVAELCTDHSVSWALHATSGHTTAQTLERLQRLPRQEFDVAVTSLGLNDAIANGTALTLAGDISANGDPGTNAAGGGGGAIYATSDGTLDLATTADLSARGGNGTSGAYGGGGGGIALVINRLT